MKLTVDTNILFSFFWDESFTKKLLTSRRFKLISPEFALTEINKYKNEIKEKTGINEREFIKRLNELKEYVSFVKRKEYSSYLKEAEKISPDKADAEFLALCIKENSVLWSNDSLLKTQDKIKVLNTEDIVNLLFS